MWNLIEIDANETRDPGAGIVALSAREPKVAPSLPPSYSFIDRVLLVV